MVPSIRSFNSIPYSGLLYCIVYVCIPTVPAVDNPGGVSVFHLTLHCGGWTWRLSVFCGSRHGRVWHHLSHTVRRESHVWQEKRREGHTGKNAHKLTALNSEEKFRGRLEEKRDESEVEHRHVLFPFPCRKKDEEEDNSEARKIATVAILKGWCSWWPTPPKMALIYLRNIMVMVIFVKAIPFGPNGPILVYKFSAPGQDLEWWHSGGFEWWHSGRLSGDGWGFEWWHVGVPVVVWGSLSGGMWGGGYSSYVKTIEQTLPQCTAV